MKLAISLFFLIMLLLLLKYGMNIKLKLNTVFLTLRFTLFCMILHICLSHNLLTDGRVMTPELFVCPQLFVVSNLIIVYVMHKNIQVLSGLDSCPWPLRLNLVRVGL